ncbi:MAG: Rid family hydrolase [Candidatus Atribacteria bacterium]|nr:Rid family hydrolase [Candidatus Atribacteria bacterium]
MGPYSQAIRAENLLFLPGQISINPETKYLQDIKDFALVNKIYSKYFEYNLPARACVGVSNLPKNAKLAIDAIAIKNGN